MSWPTREASFKTARSVLYFVSATGDERPPRPATCHPAHLTPREDHVKAAKAVVHQRLQLTLVRLSRRKRDMHVVRFQVHTAKHVTTFPQITHCLSLMASPNRAQLPSATNRIRFSVRPLSLTVSTAYNPLYGSPPRNFRACVFQMSPSHSCKIGHLISQFPIEHPQTPSRTS